MKSKRYQEVLDEHLDIHGRTHFLEGGMSCIASIHRKVYLAK
jgi:hypothetical protein